MKYICIKPPEIDRCDDFCDFTINNVYDFDIHKETSSITHKIRKFFTTIDDNGDYMEFVTIDEYFITIVEYRKNRFNSIFSLEI